MKAANAIGRKLEDGGLPFCNVSDGLFPFCGGYFEVATHITIKFFRIGPQGLIPGTGDSGQDFFYQFSLFGIIHQRLIFHLHPFNASS